MNLEEARKELEWIERKIRRIQSGRESSSISAYRMFVKKHSTLVAVIASHEH